MTDLAAALRLRRAPARLISTPADAAPEIPLDRSLLSATSGASVKAPLGLQRRCRPMTMRNPFRFLLGVAVVVLIPGAWGHAQVIPDPSFETPGYPASMNISAGTTYTVNGWTFGSTPGSTGFDGTQIWTTPGSDGVATEHHISMDTNSPGSNDHLFLQTTMTELVPGEEYMLGFDAQSEGGKGFLGVFLDGSSTASFSTGNLPGFYQTFSFSFVATGTSELLSFQDNAPAQGGSSVWDLDAITIVASVPEVRPVASAALLVIGISLVEARRIRKRMIR
jgi:hypothetical protein